MSAIGASRIAIRWTRGENDAACSVGHEHVSHVLKGHPDVARRLVATPMALLCIRPQARRFRAAVEAFLLRVDVLPWSRATAVYYGALRAKLTRSGKPLAPLYADRRASARGGRDFGHQ